MMSSENIPPAPAPDNHNPSNRKAAAPQRGAAEQEAQPPLKCPRCDSSNTKFCYYNNYSLSQPRHFCKTCRRYWTRGGALRNVPIGGGCRKTKKIKPSSSSSTAASRLLSGGEPSPADLGFRSSGGVPAMDFQLGGLSLPRLHPATAGVYTQFISSCGSGPGFGLDLLGLNSSVVQGGGGDHQISISSIESLSSMNQEMHWKLQQQRLGLIYGGDHDHQDNHNKAEKPQLAAINLFQNFEKELVPANDISGGGRKLEVGPTPTEWFFEHATHYNAPDTTTTTNSCNDREVKTTSGGNLSGIQAAAAPPCWSDIHHFNGLQ